MTLAELIIDSSPTNFESFYLKATDQTTSLVVLVAAREQVKVLRENLGDAPGIYVLQAEDSTVYVGQSKNLRDRLKSHRSSDKIKFRRVMVMFRDQSLSRYLDYAEAKIYQHLKEMGYKLDQSSLTNSLGVKKDRLLSLDKAHVATADGLIRQFLSYVVALGLAKPMVVSSRPHAHPADKPSATEEKPVEAPCYPASASTPVTGVPEGPRVLSFGEGAPVMSRAEPGALVF